MAKLLLAALLFALPVQAGAQVQDGFEDGDFTQNPAWTGDAARWQVVDRGGDRYLATDGVAESDTLVLATASAVSYGTWRFTFRHENVNLSNANGARVYLVADRADLRGPVAGYFVQLGTNNADEVRLYRQDGDPANASNRVELGRSDARLVGDDGTYAIAVTRDADGRWTIELDGQPLFTAQDATYARSTHAGVWVKHSSAAAQAYLFDDFDVAGTTGPPDTTAPRVAADAYDAALPGFRITFTEPLDAATIDAADFALSTGDALALAFSGVNPADVTLTLGAPLPSGAYTLSVRGVADAAGNALRDTTLAYTLVLDTDPPTLLSAVAVERQYVFLRFSEPVVDACDPSRYALPASDVSVVGLSCDAGTVTDTLTLWLSAPLEAGRAYTVVASNMTDAAGNAQTSTATFTLPEAVEPFDLVVNEILYAPPTGLPEYVELFNRSTKTLDLRGLTISDDTGTPRPITDAPFAVAPGGFAVVTRDTAALRAVFPGVRAVQPTAWPALNNGGDAVVVQAEGVVIDSVAYLPSWGGAGASLERRDPDGPSFSAANFGTSTDTRGGTPHAVNTLFAPDLAGPRVLFAEEFDEGTVEVAFDEPIAAASATPSAFAPDAGTVATAVLVGDARVRLTLAAGALPNTLTVRGVRDLKGNVRLDTTVAVALLPRAGAIVANEILYAPVQNPADNRPDQPEYVELFNTSGRTLALRGLSLTAPPDENGDADTLRLPENLPALPPGGFVVLYDDDARDGDPATASRLALAFPETDFTAPSIVVVPLTSVTPGGLSNSGEEIRLVRGSVALDAVAYAPAWQDAGRASVSGVALERIDPLGAANSTLNWASSAVPAGGTPGMPNSVRRDPDARDPQPGDLVLNEILYRPLADARDVRPDQAEYVEIFNTSDDALDLNGLRLLDAPDENGKIDTVRLVYRPTVLGANGYAVFYRVSGAYADAENPAALFAEAFPDAAAGVLVPQRASGFSLPDGGRALVLADA